MKRYSARNPLAVSRSSVENPTISSLCSEIKRWGKVDRSLPQ